MPTRIVWAKTDPPPSPRQQTQQQRRRNNYDDDDDIDFNHPAPPASATATATTHPHRRDNTMTSRSTRSNNQQKIHSSSIHFRGSILKELSVRNDKEEEDLVEDEDHDDDYYHHPNHPRSKNPNDEEFKRSNDMRASPRLVGYIFSMMAAAVMLVSVVQ
jgi:hypothetical protein